MSAHWGAVDPLYDEDVCTDCMASVDATHFDGCPSELATRVILTRLYNLTPGNGWKVKVVNPGKKTGVEFRRPKPTGDPT